MTSIRKAALACVASALMVLPLNAAAQGPANQDTFFTFSQSFRGMTFQHRSGF